MDTNLQEAKVAYHDLMDLFKNFGNIINGCTSENINIKGLLNKIDVVLQYSMLQIALDDNNFNIAEAKFIRDLSEHCDFVDYLKAHGVEELTWQKLYDTDEKTLKQILSIAKDDVEESAMEICKIFSVVDAASEHNFFDDLEKCFKEIMISISASDGEADVHGIETCLMMTMLATIFKIESQFEGAEGNGERRDGTAPQVKQNPSKKSGYVVDRKLINANNNYKVNYSKKEKALVYIETDSGSGSGFLIASNGLCCTCYHVIDGARKSL